MARENKGPERGDSKSAPSRHRAELSGEGVIISGDETYLSIDRAAEYLERGRSSIFNYLARFNLPTFNFPLQGKRAFIRRSDLDGLRRAVPRVGRPPKLGAPQERSQGAPVERPRRRHSGRTPDPAHQG